MWIESYAKAAIFVFIWIILNLSLVTFADQNKQSFKVISVFKSHDHVSNSYTINKFTTFFGVKSALPSCFLSSFL